MRSATAHTQLIYFALPVLISLFTSLPASAQCEEYLSGFQNISVEPGKSFQADYTTSGLLRNFTGITAGTHPISVARDSQGRVRIEGSAGKYDTKPPGGQQTEVERRMIWICDPVANNSIDLDTLNKTATVGIPLPRSDRLPPVPPVNDQRSFCTRLLDSRRALRRVRTEDLGHQTISGYDAVGLREWNLPLVSRGDESKLSESYTDWWCSDDLAALILKTQIGASRAGLPHKSETAMTNIHRREPDPTFFVIPADYTIIQRAQGQNQSLLPRHAP
jgi:hypothetical protein